MAVELTRLSLSPSMRRKHVRRTGSSHLPLERVELSRFAESEAPDKTARIAGLALGTAALGFMLVQIFTPGHPPMPQEGWALQVGSFESEGNAQSMLEQLRAKGYHPTTRTEQGRVKVLVPGFETRQEASDSQSDFEGSFPVELQSQRPTAQVPSATESVEGGYHIQVASFGQQENAQLELNRLVGHGYPAKLERGQKDGQAFFPHSGGRLFLEKRS